ncbi:hypothetical protein GCM10023215_30010 [Pseudonocardia yuanmonensis]|uniref:Uncharacterized protein n=1 Tax=Pseudonocardia yuanmonensis TaxID=1095914 RepID=A0ABP8WK28_9PSEU
MSTAWRMTPLTIADHAAGVCGVRRSLLQGPSEGGVKDLLCELGGAAPEVVAAVRSDVCEIERQLLAIALLLRHVDATTLRL